MSAPPPRTEQQTYHADKRIAFHEGTQRGHLLLQVVRPHLADAQLLVLQLLLSPHGDVVLQTRGAVGKAHLGGARSSRYARRAVPIRSNTLRAEDGVPRRR